MPIPYIVIGVIALFLILSSFVTVNQGTVAVITIFGKYRRIMGPGLNFKIPFIGIGTGKLAFAVKEYLKKHPKVRGFEDAHPSSGGFGAKVVKL